MGPIDPSIQFGRNCRLDASTKKHILFIKLSTYLSTPFGCRRQPRGVRNFHIASLFPLHDQSYTRQRPLLEKPDGPLSNPNQVLGGRAKFVGFLDKSLLQSYPDPTASIPVLIPEDFNFFRLGTQASTFPSAPTTPTRSTPRGAIVAGPVWRRHSPPPDPQASPPNSSFGQSSTSSDPASAFLHTSPSYTLAVPSTLSRPPLESASVEPAPATFLTATCKSNRGLHHSSSPVD